MSPFVGNEDLEQAILDDPDDLASWLVYGDFLQERGDPRGELLVRSLTASVDGPALDAYLQRHPPLLPDRPGPYAVREWFGGHWHTLALWDEVQADLAALLRHPCARFLRHLHLRVDAPSEALVRAAALHASPCLQLLEIGEADDPETAAGGTVDIDLLLDRFAALEVLEIACTSAAWDVIDLPALRVLRLRLDEPEVVPGDVVSAIEDGQLPALEELELWLGGAWAGVLADEIEPLLHTEQLPHLRRLALVHDGDDTATLLATLADSPLADQLTHIDLSWGNLTSQDIGGLSLDALDHLTELSLDANRLEPAEATWLESRWPFVRAQNQRVEPEDYDDGIME